MLWHRFYKILLIWQKKIRDIWELQHDFHKLLKKWKAWNINPFQFRASTTIAHSHFMMLKLHAIESDTLPGPENEEWEEDHRLWKSLIGLEIVQVGDKLFMPELHFEELRRQRCSFDWEYWSKKNCSNHIFAAGHREFRRWAFCASETPEQMRTHKRYQMDSKTRLVEEETQNLKICDTDRKIKRQGLLQWPHFRQQEKWNERGLSSRTNSHNTWAHGSFRSRAWLSQKNYRGMTL